MNESTPPRPLPSIWPEAGGSARPRSPAGSNSGAGVGAGANVPAAAAQSSKAVQVAPVRVASDFGTVAHVSPEAVAQVKHLFDHLRQEISKVYVGQEELVLGTLVALFSNGHVLIESVPGLGKTLLVRVLSRVLGCEFSRIQFTADLMPSDITGAPVYDMREQKFQFRPGPIFTQLLLADEINRSPAKTHAALLEVMQEKKVTVDGISYDMKRPFLVLATQNPIESEGTYNLPEAQLDRFLFKLVVRYPELDEEMNILRLHRSHSNQEEQLLDKLAVVTSPEAIVEAQQRCAQVRVEDRLLNYINAIVRKTREWPGLFMGASPRAGIALLRSCQTMAAFAGRDFAVPDDVVDFVLPVLRHRVILAPEAEVEGQRTDDVLQEMLRTLEVPRT